MGSLRWMNELGVGLGPLQTETDRLQQGGATLSALAERRPEGLVLRALMVIVPVAMINQTFPSPVARVPCREC